MVLNNIKLTRRKMKSALIVKKLLPNTGFIIWKLGKRLCRISE